MKHSPALLLLLLPLSVDARLTDQTVDLGLEMWTAFQCASLTQKLGGMSSERNRLVTFGFEQGLKFVKSANEEKIELELGSELPSLVQFYVIDGGPSPEFVLGRIYQSAMNGVYEELLEGTSSIEVTRERARTKLQQQRCEQIGR